ncbi:hypothetical protein Glove_230g15 [Diversispora epigaea]|uniref:Uncharacterized protein n=1 Tax=Diversispora epigaea TaxID=1348612 RepID=A0A397IKT8_9GLOM|nr:hypothetical protein Glove_230g15 [Diversispora epigaea]
MKNINKTNVVSTRGRGGRGKNRGGNRGDDRSGRGGSVGIRGRTVREGGVRKISNVTREKGRGKQGEIEATENLVNSPIIEKEEISSQSSDELDDWEKGLKRELLENLEVADARLFEGEELVAELDENEGDLERVLKELEEEMEKELNEGSRGDDNYISEEDIPLSILKKRRKSNKDDNSEDIPLKILWKRRKLERNSYTTKTTTSADIPTINKYKIETLNEYQQVNKHFEQQIVKYNKTKRSLVLYFMKANEIQMEIKDSDFTNIHQQNLEKTKKLFGDNSKCQEEIKTFYELQDDLRMISEACNKAVLDGFQLFSVSEDIPLSILKKRRKSNKDDNSEDIPLKILWKRRKLERNSYTTKTTTSADIPTINKYKIETLNEYQQVNKHFEQQIVKYNKTKRSLVLYFMKANEIQMEIKDSDFTNIHQQNLEKTKKLFGDNSKCQEEIKTFYELQDDLRMISEACNKAVLDGVYE